jgi:hypothetical protein
LNTAASRRLAKIEDKGGCFSIRDSDGQTLSDAVPTIVVGTSQDNPVALDQSMEVLADRTYRTQR